MDRAERWRRAARPGDFPRREQVTVDFSNAVPEVGRITSLEVPHRMADAILRDSEYDAKKIRDSAGVNVQGTRRRNFRAISGAASLKPYAPLS